MPAKKKSSRKPKLRARKALSQNFLVDPAIADRIVDSLPFKPAETVYEIGAGKGYLTERLVAAGAMVKAVEKDRRLFRMLQKKFPDHPRVDVYHADVLDLPSPAEPPTGCWLLGNLPFGIGHPILQWMFDRRDRFRGAVLTLQREVVARLLAPPGTRARSAVSIWFQARATGEALFNIPPRAFIPPPRVTSTVMRVEFVSLTPGVEGVPGIEYIVECAFAQKRKILANNLRAMAGLSDADWDRLRRECGDLLRKRAEAMKADEFVRLAKTLALDAGHPDCSGRAQHPR